MTEKPYDQAFLDAVAFVRDHKDPGQEVEVFIQANRQRPITDLTAYKFDLYDPAAGRFWFKQGPVKISVYYDTENNLGHMPWPYFEIYPDKDGMTQRFKDEPGEWPIMLKALQEAVREKAIRMVLGETTR